MTFEKKEDPAKILIKAAIIEAPVLILGVVLFLMTGNLVWIIGAAVLGGAIMIPAVLRVKKIQERDNASR